MVNKYKIADKVIEINSIYEKVHTYCIDYLSEEPADITVAITQADIDNEREKSKNEDIKEGIAVREFPDDYLEGLAVYRKIADSMLMFDTVLFHGSVVAVDGQGYLFTAKSGTGKSTHTRLWREYFRDRAVMINDDKPLINIADDKITVYGTPWDGKHRLSTNTSVPLKAICILTRADENKIEQITMKEAYTKIVQQIYRPSDALKMMKTLELVDKLMDNVKLYQLGCNMDISAAKTAYEGMQ